MPGAAMAIEVAPDRVAAARWSRTGSLDGYAVESLPVGALVPSAVEANLVNVAAVKAAFGTVCDRLRSRDEDVALILPDTVIRVFVQHFEEFPRSAAEAEPMLRWPFIFRTPGSRLSSPSSLRDLARVSPNVCWLWRTNSVARFVRCCTPRFRMSASRKMRVLLRTA